MNKCVLCGSEKNVQDGICEECRDKYGNYDEEFEKYEGD